jgi:hypothetical protein
MESLIELVAASLARYGIECPDGVSRSMWGRATSTVQASIPPAEPTALPEHNYRKILNGDPAP